MSKINPLEKLKDKLKIKPKVEPLKLYDITLPGKPTKQEDVELKKVKIVDERKKTSKIDMDKLREQLRENRLTKVVEKDTLKPTKKDSTRDSTREKVQSLVKEPAEKKAPTSKKIKKLTLKLRDDEEEGEKVLEKGEEREEEEEEREEEVPKKKEDRKTKRTKKGVAELSVEDWLDIDNIPVLSRLPPKIPHVNIKVSNYYMNNREIFVNFINSLFEPYRDEVMSDEAEITCDSIGKTNKEFTLLTHQKIVRDYLNLYTPYRGLLLYFGLGAGKSNASIAIAEGMKTEKQIIVMTPASLRRNYIEEIKKFGDAIYRKNQFWEWIPIKTHRDDLETLSTVLNLSQEYIERKGGVWLLNVKKPSNAGELTSDQSKSLDDQLDEMIQTKYKFINYNGLRRDKLRDMTNNFERNIFDNSVVIIDEAHNLMSRIVNKISKEKDIAVDKEGNKERVPYSLALILYEMLMDAQNTKVVLLTGTPIINYPNEIGILFNILRGYIKTWEIPLEQNSAATLTKEKVEEMFKREKTMDYIDYSTSSKKLMITRNPFGFENKRGRDDKYLGVSNTNVAASSKEKNEEPEITRNTIVVEKDTDKVFERKILSMLKENKIEAIPSGIIIHKFKALPDKLDDFVNRFIEAGTGNLKNEELFKRRILGLTSYFRSAQESLMPKYEKAIDFHVLKIPMSNYQFGIYEEARQNERKLEKSSKMKKTAQKDENGIYKEPSSTYRIFSRLYCNYVMPKPPGRPLPQEDRKVDDEAEIEKGEKGDEGEKAEKAQKAEKKRESMMETLYTQVLKETEKKGPKDLEGEGDGELEGDQILDGLADAGYEKRLQNAIQYLREHEEQCLSPKALETYSPKFLNILENIQDPENIGLHLIYSQFRTLEGIGIFKMVLEANGFAQFKIKKDASGIWELDIPEEDFGKPMFALYTGTESSEEKEVVRTIYNSQWDQIATSSPKIVERLKKMANNNNVGEIIKVFMITASGAEGINLRNTRFVHVMEPYWHPARMEQVIGRARRICSHKDLPEALQTVEVFLYLMTFSEEQIKTEASIELKNKDLSKRMYNVNADKEGAKPDMKAIPFTSDEALYEISTIKEEVTDQLLKAMKESSIDCAIYSKRGAKEQLNCIQFGQPTTNSFSYKPSISGEQPDTVSTINKRQIEWRGQEVKIKGKKYIYRKMNERVGNLYDYESYLRALEKAGVEPVLVATLEINEKGQQIVKKI